MTEPTGIKLRRRSSAATARDASDADDPITRLIAASGVELRELVEEQLIKPGSGSLILYHNDITHTATLLPNGTIHFNNTIYLSPTEAATAAITSSQQQQDEDPPTTTTKPPIDGWLIWKHSGRIIDHYRREFLGLVTQPEQSTRGKHNFDPDVVHGNSARSGGGGRGGRRRSSTTSKQPHIPPTQLQHYKNLPNNNNSNRGGGSGGGGGGNVGPRDKVIQRGVSISDWCEDPAYVPADASLVAAYRQQSLQRPALEELTADAFRYDLALFHRCIGQTKAARDIEDQRVLTNRAPTDFLTFYRAMCRRGGMQPWHFCYPMDRTATTTDHDDYMYNPPPNNNPSTLPPTTAATVSNSFGGSGGAAVNTGGTGGGGSISGAGRRKRKPQPLDYESDYGEEEHDGFINIIAGAGSAGVTNNNANNNTTTNDNQQQQQQQQTDTIAGTTTSNGGYMNLNNNTNPNANGSNIDNNNNNNQHTAATDNTTTNTNMYNYNNTSFGSPPLSNSNTDGSRLLWAERRINFKSIFATMSNYTPDNRMTSVANMLIKKYKMFLLQYQIANEDRDLLGIATSGVVVDPPRMLRTGNGGTTVQPIQQYYQYTAATNGALPSSLPTTDALQQQQQPVGIQYPRLSSSPDVSISPATSQDDDGDVNSGGDGLQQQQKQQKEEVVVLEQVAEKLEKHLATDSDTTTNGTAEGTIPMDEELLVEKQDDDDDEVMIAVETANGGQQEEEGSGDGDDGGVIVTVTTTTTTTTTAAKGGKRGRKPKGDKPAGVASVVEEKAVKVAEPRRSGRQR